MQVTWLGKSVVLHQPGLGICCGYTYLSLTVFLLITVLDSFIYTTLLIISKLVMPHFDILIVIYLKIDLFLVRDNWISEISSFLWDIFFYSNDNTYLHHLFSFIRIWKLQIQILLQTIFQKELNYMV